MKKIIIFIILLFIYFYLSIIDNRLLLTDDLSTGFIHNYSDSWGLGYFDFIKKYMGSPNMTSRPISSIFFYSIIYLMKFNEKFYYLNYIFFPISIFSVYLTSSSLIHKNYSVIFTIFYALMPFGSSLVFSPIMMNSNLASIFYCFSFLCLVGRYKNFYLSAIFMLFSILSYEVFIPLLLLNIIFVKGDLRKRLLYFIYVLGLFLIYKKLIEPHLFTNYVKREKVENIFQIKRHIILVKLSLKMIILDFPKSLFKSFLAIKYYSIGDFFSLITFSLFSVYIIFRTKFDLLLSFNKLKYISILGLFLCFIIFPLSYYEPIFYGFSNRTLGAIRLFFSLFLVVFALSISFKRENFNQNQFKIIISVFLIMFLISSISIKNAWLFSGTFNRNLFTKLSTHINKNLKSKYIYINYRDEEYQKENYILKEPIFLEHWETSALKMLNNIPSYYDIYYYKNPSNKFPEKYYIYDYQKDKLFFINNK